MRAPSRHSVGRPNAKRVIRPKPSAAKSSLKELWPSCHGHSGHTRGAARNQHSPADDDAPVYV